MSQNSEDPSTQRDISVNPLNHFYVSSTISEIMASKSPHLLRFRQLHMRQGQAVGSGPLHKARDLGGMFKAYSLDPTGFMA